VATRRDAALRRRPPRWSAESCAALELDPAWLPPALSRGSAGRTPGRRPVAAGAGDQAAGALGVGVTRGGGPLSVVLGTSGVVFAGSTSTRPSRPAAYTPSATRCPAPGTRWA
jgi:sugar (pentulose or hexulose) kinase